MINNVVLAGRITKDIELRFSPNGTAVARFTLAVNRTFKSQNGEQQADFISIVAFKKTAENTANFCKKGSLVGIVGRIQTGSYEGQDGKRVYTTEVVADNIQFLDSKSSSDTQQAPQRQRNNEAFTQDKVEVGDSDLPF